MQRPERVSVTRQAQRDATVLGGLRLRYVDVPPAREAAPPVVLLHGLASRLEEYEDLFEPLAARQRVVSLDLPGNGYSDKPDRRYTLRFFEDAVCALLDHLRLDEVDLAGGSLGGNLVLRLAHRFPSRFRRLAPWAPAGAWEPMHALGLVGSVLRRTGTRLFWPTVWIQSRYWYRPDWPGRARALDEAFEHYREVMSPGLVRMYFEIGQEQVRTSLYPIAHAIPHPTLLGWGSEDDGLGMGAGVKRLVGLLPDARLRVYEGARHSLAAEVPGELSRDVGEFFAGASP